ncbi:hypothetical protein RDWZM_006378 [Blomia tropicalis]|uniref:Uncharacterized protein n=1 Tax=Blomia tropicalis TaxID=40697 RepID=A0A9Q0RNB7_BLOTA|nr:hypothetical protein RDWZM_006378 [Blomia tropicalis]
MSKFRSSTFNSNAAKDQIILAEGYLPTDKIVKIDKYLRAFGFLSQTIEEYLQGDMRGKLKSPTRRMYAFILHGLMWLVCIRNLLLQFVDDVTIRNYLGEAHSARPADQINMTLTIWSIYLAFLFKLYYKGERLGYMNWLTPFAVFKGVVSPTQMGLSTPMTDLWFSKTKRAMAKMLIFLHCRAGIGAMMFCVVFYRRWNTKSVPPFPLIIWNLILLVWLYYGSALIYLTFGYFYALAGYLRMRFHKVNEDIETIIAPDSRLKPNERCALLYHILVEHNEICIKISAFFTYNTVIVRTVMFMVTLEGAYILTKVSIAAARLANEIIAALGQNFLLIIDFVRSYAELKEEHYSDSELDIGDIGNVFNTTLNMNSLSSLSTNELNQVLPEMLKQ